MKTLQSFVPLAMEEMEINTWNILSAFSAEKPEMPPGTKMRSFFVQFAEGLWGLSRHFSAQYMQKYPNCG